MELQHLRAFAEVARELSFTRAAKNLHCAQSTVTGQIKRLEADLGVVLFHRRGRCPIELTEAGVLLQQRTELILRVVETTSREIRQARGGCRPAAGAQFGRTAGPHRGPGPTVSPKVA
jgi:DNA-binding transcriptional LysR family regulator